MLHHALFDGLGFLLLALQSGNFGIHIAKDSGNSLLLRVFRDGEFNELIFRNVIAFVVTDGKGQELHAFGQKTEINLSVFGSKQLNGGGFDFKREIYCRFQ